MSRNTRNPAQGDGLSLDVLESVVGAAGLERKQDLTAEQAAALTAGTHDAPPLAPANDAGLTKKQIEDIEDKFHKSAATPMKIGTEYKHFAVEREGKYIKGEGWKGGDAKYAAKGTAYDQRDHDAKTASAEHQAAQQATKAADSKLATLKDTADKLTEHHKASKDLLKAQDRPKAPVSVPAVRDDADGRDRSKTMGAGTKHIDDVVTGAKQQVQAKYDALEKAWDRNQQASDNAKDAAAKLAAAQKAVQDTKVVKNAAIENQDAAKKGLGLKHLPDDHAAQKAYKAASADHHAANRALHKQTIETNQAVHNENFAAHKTEKALLSHEAVLKAYGQIRGLSDQQRSLQEHAVHQEPPQARTTDDGKKASKPNPVAWQNERLQKAADAIKTVSGDDSPATAEKKVAIAKSKVADSTEKEAAAKTKADDLAARNSKAAVDAEKVQKSRDDLKSSMMGKQAVSKTLGFAHDALLSAAKDQAIKDKTYEGGERQNVLAGGVSSQHSSKVVDGKAVDEKLDKIAQVKTTVLEETYSGTGVLYAHKTQKTITAEAGVEKTTSVTTNGVTHTETLKANASITGEYLKKGEITATRIAGEIGVKAVGHAEASVTTSDQYGSVKLTHTMAAVVHGEVGAKAGGSIGVDGLKVSVGASAEIVAKACDIHEVAVGNLTIKNELEVYATAKAQAKAEAEVNFNPFSGEKLGAKVSAALEASAGVGIQDTISINKNLDVGAGAYIGKIGAKADVDIGLKDGKMNVNVDVGAALGVGLSVKFKAEVDVAGTANKAAEQIRNGNVVEKAGGVLSFVPTVFLARALFG